jgi:hypothetical protein
MNEPDYQGKSDCAIFVDPLPKALRRAADFIEQLKDGPMDDGQVVVEGENEDGDWRVLIFYDRQAL